MIDELILKICKKSETIGRWIEFLDKMEDWSNPYVTIAQNHIKKFSEERSVYIKELKELIKEKENENKK